MTDHEMVLLRAAVEAYQAQGSNVFIPIRADGAYFAQLLRDIGADVPEWPSEERVEELERDVARLGATTTLASYTLPEYLALRGGS